MSYSLFTYDDSNGQTKCDIVEAGKRPNKLNAQLIAQADNLHMLVDMRDKQNAKYEAEFIAKQKKKKGCK